MTHDPIEMLIADHRAVDQLFKRTKDDSENLQALADQIASELTTHTQMEETIFYPAVQQRAKAKSDVIDDWMVKHSYDEHNLVKKMLQELSEKRGDESATKSTLWRIEKAVKLHVFEEEKLLLPHARDLLESTELEGLGSQMFAIKQHRPAA